jgi:nucleotide-binding universal stress UspA family protein
MGSFDKGETSMTTGTLPLKPTMQKQRLIPPSSRSAVVIRRFLVPVDLSSDTLDRLQPAVSLARRFGATLAFLHVYERPSCFHNARGPYAYVDRKLHRLDLKNALLALRDRVRHQYPRCYSFLLDGPDVVQTTVTAAEELNIDLIVVPVAGRDWPKKSLKSATAEAIVRQAGCPVLVVPGIDHPVEAAA